MPYRIRSALRKSYYSSVDTLELLLRRRDRLTPPKRKSLYVGGGDFRGIGQEFCRYFIELGKLQPDERVLDVGCGIGRMAVPLARYLSEDGEYWGFDIVRDGIEWCERNLAKQFPNFHFQWVNIYNKSYNPLGQYKASEYKFSYEDAAFDFAFATSVFTHLLPPDTENYLSEMSRVLKPGGRCLITFFLLNDDSLRLIKAGASTLDFQYELDGCLTVNEGVPEAAVVYDERLIRELCQRYHLEVAQPIRYGSWCGRGEFLSYQDIIVAAKA